MTTRITAARHDVYDTNGELAGFCWLTDSALSDYMDTGRREIAVADMLALASRVTWDVEPLEPDTLVEIG